MFIATNPVLIVLLSVIFLKEKISRRQLVGLVFAVLGGFYIIINGDVKQFLAIGLSKFDFVLLGAVVSWAVYTVVGKVVLRKFSSIVTTTYAVGFGTLFYIPFIWSETTWEEILTISLPTWISILHLSVIVTVISFVMWYEGVKQVGASKASIFINIMPISAVFMAIIFKGEGFTIYYLLGGVMVLTGIYISNSRSKRKDIVKTVSSPDV